MIAANIKWQIHELVASQIAVQDASDGSYAVDVPLMFPDGDCCRVFVDPGKDGTWNVRDGGSSASRAAYAAGVDVLSPGYKDRFQNIIQMHGLSEDRGEVSCLESKDLGDAVFSVAQAAIDIVYLARLPRAKPAEKASKFFKKLSDIITFSVGQRAIPDWHNETDDPPAHFPVTYRIDTPSSPLFVFGANTKMTCMHATMSCLFHKRLYPLKAVAVYESEETIPKLESQRLDSVVDHHFRSLAERDSIVSCLKSIAG